MSNPLERPPLLNRRQAIQLVSAGTAAIILPQLIDQPALIFAQERYPYKVTNFRFRSNDLWFPAQEGALNNGGNIYRPGGPFTQYDRANQTDVRGEVEKIYRGRAARGELAPWSGFCNAAANVNNRLAYLEAAGVITQEQSDDIFSDPIKYGLAVALLQGDVAKRVALGQDSDSRARNNEDNLNWMVKEERPFVAQMEYLPGKWFFDVHGVEGNEVYITGFGFTTKMSINNMVDSYYPVRFHEAEKMNLPLELLYEGHLNRFTALGIGFEESKVTPLLGLSTPHF